MYTQSRFRCGEYFYDRKKWCLLLMLQLDLPLQLQSSSFWMQSSPRVRPYSNCDNRVSRGDFWSVGGTRTLNRMLLSPAISWSFINLRLTSFPYRGLVDSVKRAYLSQTLLSIVLLEGRMVWDAVQLDRICSARVRTPFNTSQGLLTISFSDGGHDDLSVDLKV